MRAPEIAHHVLLGVAPFLVSDDDATLAAKHGHTAWHGTIVSKAAIAVQFDPVGKNRLLDRGPNGLCLMPGVLDLRQSFNVVINPRALSRIFYLKFFPPPTEIDIVLRRMTLQILQPPFQFKYRFFKIERLPFHG